MDMRHMLAYAQTREHLVMRAQAASLKGMHFEDFLVGSAMFAWREDVEPFQSPYNVFCGANKKPEEDSVTFCAEPGALDGVRMAGYTDIVSVTIYGPHLGHEDRRSKKTPETLHPCHRCRVILNYAKEILDNTVIHCVLNGRDDGTPAKFEEMTFLELLAYHGEVRIPKELRK